MLNYFSPLYLVFKDARNFLTLVRQIRGGFAMHDVLLEKCDTNLNGCQNIFHHFETVHIDVCQM